MCFFWDLRVLARNFASPFGYSMQVVTQVQLASTCDYLPFRMPRAQFYIPVKLTELTERVIDDNYSYFGSDMDISKGEFKSDVKRWRQSGVEWMVM